MQNPGTPQAIFETPDNVKRAVVQSMLGSQPINPSRYNLAMDALLANPQLFQDHYTRVMGTVPQGQNLSPRPVQIEALPDVQPPTVQGQQQQSPSAPVAASASGPPVPQASAPQAMDDAGLGPVTLQDLGDLESMQQNSASNAQPAPNGDTVQAVAPDASSDQLTNIAQFADKQFGSLLDSAIDDPLGTNGGGTRTNIDNLNGIAQRVAGPEVIASAAGAALAYILYNRMKARASDVSPANSEAFRAAMQALAPVQTQAEQVLRTSGQFEGVLSRVSTPTSMNVNLDANMSGNASGDYVQPTVQETPESARGQATLPENKRMSNRDFFQSVSEMSAPPERGNKTEAAISDAIDNADRGAASSVPTNQLSMDEQMIDYPTKVDRNTDGNSVSVVLVENDKPVNVPIQGEFDHNGDHYIITHNGITFNETKGYKVNMEMLDAMPNLPPIAKQAVKDFNRTLGERVRESTMGGVRRTLRVQ